MRISTKSTKNFESTGTNTELKQRRFDVRDQWLLMQGTKVQKHRLTTSRSASPWPVQRWMWRAKTTRTDSNVQLKAHATLWEHAQKNPFHFLWPSQGFVKCILRDQRDTLRISWNDVCKVIRFVQSVNSTFCTVSWRFKLGIVHQFQAITTTYEQFPRSTCCVRVCCDNITQLCRVLRNDTNESLFHTQRDSV